MELEELNVYTLAMELGEKVWNISDCWSFFNKDTIGKQLVRCADSVAANISEGFGRYFYKETINFSYYARGSLFETKTWLTKAYSRKLIQETEYNELMQHVKTLGIKLNNYISTLKSHSTKKPKKPKEQQKNKQ